MYRAPIERDQVPKYVAKSSLYTLLPFYSVLSEMGSGYGTSTRSTRLPHMAASFLSLDV